MTASNACRTISIASGETIALDLRARLFPVGYVIRVPNGTRASRKFSNANVPGNRYVTQPQNATVTAGAGGDRIVGQEMSPIGWLQVRAASGPASLDISANEPAAIPVHSSTGDAITAKAAPSVSIAVGETRDFRWQDLFNYEQGFVDLAAVSATPGNVTAAFDPETEILTLTGVAAAASTNVTVTGTTPTETSAAVTLAVTTTA